jgi:hypothetical protein
MKELGRLKDSCIVTKKPHSKQCGKKLSKLNFFFFFKSKSRSKACLDMRFFYIIFFYFFIIFKIVNTNRIYFLKLCLDSLENLIQNSKKLDKI